MSYSQRPATWELEHAMLGAWYGFCDGEVHFVHFRSFFSAFSGGISHAWHPMSCLILSDFRVAAGIAHSAHFAHCRGHPRFS